MFMHAIFSRLASLCHQFNRLIIIFNLKLSKMTVSNLNQIYFFKSLIGLTVNYTQKNQTDEILSVEKHTPQLSSTSSRE